MNPAIEAWIVIEKLGALVATPGVSAEVQEVANQQIKKLIDDVIAPSLTSLTAKSVGIITK